MRSFKWYAILLTIVLVVSGRCPASAIEVAAAETIAVEENGEEENAVLKTEPEAEDTTSEDEEVAEAVTDKEGSSVVEESRTESDDVTEADAEEEAEAATEADTEMEADTAEVIAEEETSDEKAITEDKKEEVAVQEEISDEKETVDEEETAEEESVISEGGDSSDEMFATYVDSVFSTGGSAKPMLKARRATAGSRLTGVSKIIYDYISAEIVKIANGERASTKFVIPVEELGLEKGKWYKDDLGVDTIRVYDPELGKNVLTPETTAACYAKLGVNLPEEFEKSLNALLADYPYQLYWFNKVQGVSLSIFVHTSSYVRVADNYTMSFAVNEEYEDPYEYYVVDTSIGQTVRNSAAYAASIVEQHAEEEDYEKLVSYRDEICRLTSYNTQNFSETDYGDPWQLIWVFDQEPNTKVVCEGYSKAFQYLFNLSTFENELGCLLITGDVDFGSGDPGGHMWNVVSMDDDQNYLVDVTNSDAGSTGSEKLFLVGAKGTPQDGYTVDIGYTYHYDEDALSIWNEEELSLYGEHARYYPCWRTFGEWEIVTAPTYISEGLRRNQCTDCGLTVEEVMPMLVPTSVDDLDITGIAAKTYTGEPLTQDLVVMDGDDVLTEGVHYTVEYSNNIDATEEIPDAPATVTITGILENGYTGSVVKEFQIEKAPNAITVDTARIDEVYSTRDRAYTIGAEALGGNITYSSNNDGVEVSSEGKVTIEAGFLGEANITITAGDNNYKTATKKVPVIVVPATVKNLIFTGIVSKTYTGDPLTQNLVVKDGDAVLTEGVHYTVEYANNTDATEDTPDAPATVTITGILENGYTGSVVKKFQIKKAPNAITVKTASITKVYSTKDRTYSIGAEVSGGEISYRSNKKAVRVSDAGKVTIGAKFIGKAIITVTGRDKNYKTVTKRVSIVVNPTGTCILSLTSPKAGQVLVTYKKNMVGTGYQIQLSLNKKFSPSVVAWVTSNKTLKRKIGSLKKQQKYYVRIRTYKLVNGVKYYSKWSAIKAVRIKK